MKICMIVPNSTVKGGIAAVVNGYREHNFGERYRITYVESYCDGSKMRKLLKALGSYFCFLKVIITNRPDLIHIHSSFGPSFYRKMPFIYLGKMFRIPIINHIHGAEFDPFYGKASEQKKRLIQKVYRKCTRLIALSDEWKKNLKLIVPEDKITVLPNYCIVPEKVNPERKRQILFLGEIGKRKGCFDIPDILEKANLRGLDATMVFAGAGSREDEEALKKELAKRNLDKNVKFAGWVNGREKTKLLEESRIFLFPSYNEGMPMAVLEAMAYGLAVVTTRIGGITNLITDGQTGFLAKPGENEFFAQKIEKLLQEPELAQRLGEGARQKAKEKYSFESHLNSLLRIYEETVKESDVSRSNNT